MTKFFDAFSASTKAEWETQFLADLKGQELNVLQMQDEVEEITFSAYYHREDRPNPEKTPLGKRDFSDSNSWNNGCLIEIDDEKKANQLALDRLNSGVNLLVFKSLKENPNWKMVLENIQLEFIESHFLLRSLKEYQTLKNVCPLPTSAYLSIDFFDDQLSWSDFEEIAKDFHTVQKPFCLVNGFALQQCGANSWQEITYALSAGHEYLVRLMKSGMTIDEAAACVHFNLGIGSRFVIEIAKFRAFRQAWGQIVSAYQPAHTCSLNSHITAIVGHLNKSLKDPYSNLLRQTTEAMSAIIGGTNGMIVLPYDLYGQNPSELAARMAINISSIVQEESYLDKVNDPLGGSYSQENLTAIIGEKAWMFFQKLEKSGGISTNEAQETLRNEVLNKRALRIERLHHQKDTLIGINKYLDPNEHEDQWHVLPIYLGIQYLALETALKTEQVV